MRSRCPLSPTAEPPRFRARGIDWEVCSPAVLAFWSQPRERRGSARRRWILASRIAVIPASGRSPTTASLPRPIATTALAWMAMLGVDLFLHAGLLAPLYDWDSPFLLEPMTAFVRIPVGYLAFLVLAAGLAWLLPDSALMEAVRVPSWVAPSGP